MTVTGSDISLSLSQQGSLPLNFLSLCSGGGEKVQLGGSQQTVKVSSPNENREKIQDSTGIVSQ